jgi:hypothetical protein
MSERIRRPALARALIPYLGGALLIAGGLTAAPVNAQDMFGALEAQGAFASQQQYAASLHEQFSRRYDADEGNSGGPPPPGLTLEEANALDAAIRERNAERDAEYQRWLEGSWRFFQSREPAEPGEFCAAMFQGPQGMIALSGVDKSWDGALLMFTGDDIPKPRRFGEVTVRLTQTGEPPVTIRAYNRARDPRMNTLGTLVIAVPAMDAALAGMADEQEFALSMGGREVFRMSWKNGLQAAAELRNCLRER